MRTLIRDTQKALSRIHEDISETERKISEMEWAISRMSDAEKTGETKVSKSVTVRYQGYEDIDITYTMHEPARTKAELQEVIDLHKAEVKKLEADYERIIETAYASFGEPPTFDEIVKCEEGLCRVQLSARLPE